jgi:hypothetical protein
MSICSQCMMSIPSGARVCPFCRGDRSGDLRREAEAEAVLLRLGVSALLFGMPVCLLWYKLPLGSAYPGAFWLILPAVSLLGCRVVDRYLGPALWLSTAYMLAGGYYLFWFEPGRQRRTPEAIKSPHTRGRSAQGLIGRGGQPDARHPRSGLAGAEVLGEGRGGVEDRDRRALPRRHGG